MLETTVLSTTVSLDVLVITKECNSMKETMMGQVYEINPIAKLFQGGYITNDWEVLVKRTAVFFRWMVAIARKMTGDNNMLASNIAMLFLIK